MDAFPGVWEIIRWCPYSDITNYNGHVVSLLSSPFIDEGEACISQMNVVGLPCKVSDLRKHLDFILCVQALYLAFGLYSLCSGKSSIYYTYSIQKLALSPKYCV